MLLFIKYSKVAKQTAWNQNLYKDWFSRSLQFNTDQKKNKWKIIFRTKYGHFEYQIMLFGFMNTPIMCQELLNWVLGDILDENSIVYFDNILIYSKTGRTCQTCSTYLTIATKTWFENWTKRMFFLQRWNKILKILNWNTWNHYKIKQNQKNFWSICTKNY